MVESGGLENRCPGQPGPRVRISTSPVKFRSRPFEMACVYILYSKKRNHFYKGSSHENGHLSRLEAHNAGKVKSTKAGIPWELVHVEFFDEYSLARKRELFLKTGPGRTWIKEQFRSLTVK